MDETRRLGIGGGLAAGLHALIGVWLAWLPQRSAYAATLRAHTVEIVVVPAEPRHPEPALPAPRPSPIPVPRRSPSPSPSPSPSLTPEPASPSLSPRALEREPAPASPIPSLAPVEVARSALTRDAPGPSLPGPAAPRDLPSDSLPDIHARLAEIAEGLGRDANATASHPREPPHLVAHPDGTLRWQGPNFAVVIRPDGEVVFDDQDALTYDWTTGRGTVDLDQILFESQGQDPFVHERIWFMHATEEIRETREDHARAEREARALRRLSGRLARIWQSVHATPEERRHALFELWDESADDERGQRARDLVLAFVRDNLPAGTESAFSSHELATLNAERRSASRFAPY